MQAVNNLASTILHDLSKEEVMTLHDRLLNYGNEKSYAERPAAGLSADYVARETARAPEGVRGVLCTCTLVQGEAFPLLADPSVADAA